MIIVSISTLFAKEGAAAETYKSKSFFAMLYDMYFSGGPFMYVLTFLLACMLIMAILKHLQLTVKEKLDAKSFYLKLKGYIQNQQYKEAENICSQFKDTTMGFIFWNGFVAFNDALESGKRGADLTSALNNGFDEASLQRTPHLSAGIFWLEIIGQVAVLLGLLGTIFGLVESFDAVANAPEAMKSVMLSNGIAKAMGTTAFGLIIAIPTLFIRGGLQNKADKITAYTDEYSVKAINQITYSLKD